jgi:hypothetical protein
MRVGASAKATQNDQKLVAGEINCVLLSSRHRRRQVQENFFMAHWHSGGDQKWSCKYTPE